jgi:hypothetical protein
VSGRHCPSCGCPVRFGAESEPTFFVCLHNAEHQHEWQPAGYEPGHESKYTGDWIEAALLMLCRCGETKWVFPSQR